MGLEGTATRMIWVVAFLGAAGSVVALSFDVLATDHAMTTPRSAIEGAVTSRLEAGIFCYDPGRAQSNVTALNAGEPLDITNTTVLVDGTVRAANATVDGYGASPVWGSGLVGRWTVGMPEEPDRILIVTAHGTTLAIEPGSCPVLTSATISPTSATLTAGTQRTFEVRGFDQYGEPISGYTFAWTTDGGSVESLGETTGRLTASTTTATSRTITASSGLVSVSATFDIIPDVPASVVVTPDVAGVAAGSSRAFSAVVLDQYGNANASATVSWSTDAGSITTDGLLTAQTTAAAGRSVTATADANGVAGSAVVDVVADEPVAATVAPSSVTIAAGSQWTFTATLTDVYGNVNETAAIVWTTDAGSITSGGVLTAQTTAADDLTVTATSGAASASASVDIMPAAPATATIVPEDTGVTVGTTKQFTATFYDAYGNVNTTAPIVWSTDAGSVSPTGLLTASTTSASGRTVSATWSSVSAATTVDVIADAPASIVVGPDDVGVPAGAGQAFEATVRDQYGNLNTTAAIAWSTDAGTVSSAGMLTAQLTPASGLSVTATATTNGVFGSADVTVYPASPASVDVAPSPASVTAGTTQAFTATVYDTYGNANATAPITWSTDAGSISSAGLLSAQTTAASGKTVTATTTGGVSGQASVSIVADAPTSVTVSPSSASVAAGGTQSFSATAYDQYGNTVTAATFAWTTTAGSVSSDGVLTAQTTAASGKTVTATTTGSVSGSASVTIVPGPLASITVTPATPTVLTNAQQTFTAQGYDAHGNARSGDAITWTTSSGSITTAGLYTAPSTTGTSTITATSGSIQGTATAEVWRNTHVSAMGTYSGSTPQTTFAKGTTVTTRVTILDHDNVAVSGALVNIEIRDPSGTLRCNCSGTTDGSGVATIAYTLPNANLNGQWSVKTSLVTLTSTSYTPTANVVTTINFTEA